MKATCRELGRHDSSVTQWTEGGLAWKAAGAGDRTEKPPKRRSNDKLWTENGLSERFGGAPHRTSSLAQWEMFLEGQ